MNLQRVAGLLLCLLGGLAWIPPVRAAAWETALQAQTDPHKLSTLPKRGANPRVHRIVFYLREAQANGTAPGAALAAAFTHNGTTGMVAVLSQETLLLNYQHALDWGLFSQENLENLRRGEAPTITRGRHEGSKIDVDHIVPVSLAPEAGNSLANLELQPASVNRSKGARVGLYELRFAGRLHAAGILHDGTLWRVRWVFFRGHVLPWLVLAGVLGLFYYRKRAGGLSSHEILAALFSGVRRSLFRHGKY